MTLEQSLLFGLFGLVFAFLIWGKIRYDIVAFGALMLAVVLGLVPTKEAFSGFGHDATLVVALVLVISAGLVRSGAVFLITRTLVNAGRSLGAHIALMGAIGGLLSAFMNNVAALALLMPVDIQTSRKAGREPGLSLMPLSFCTILGGMVTLIGTPPNIIIAGIREDTLGEPFAMFDFAPVGGTTALVGLIFVALIGWRLIPQPERSQSGTVMPEMGSYIAELTIPEESKHVGKTVIELLPDAEKNDVEILGVVRDGKRLPGLGQNQVIEPGDALVLEASPDALDEFRTALSLDFADKKRDALLKSDGYGLRIIEVVVTETSRLNGRSAMAVGLSWRQRTVLLGISREGRTVRSQIRRTILKPGDILLLLVPKDKEADVVAWTGALPLAERGLAVTQDEKVWIAIGIFALAVVAASLGFLYLPIALGCVVVAFVLLRIMPIEELYSHIEWPVVVLLGSMIPLGSALESSGGTELIAQQLVSWTEGLPAWAILTVLMVVTMTLSDVLNNTATVIVAAPVGIEMSRALGVDPDPFLMAVAVAASAAFLTPIGHKNNTLVMGPGGYRFGDYWRMGLPLEILIVAVSIPAILVFWPL